MNTKKFIAADMRQALKLVRDDLGADAVILSNRKVAGGIEIIAAADYEQFLDGHNQRERKNNHMPECMDDTSSQLQQGDPNRLVQERSEGLSYSKEDKTKLFEALARHEEANKKFNAAYEKQLEQKPTPLAVTAYCDVDGLTNKGMESGICADEHKTELTISDKTKVVEAPIQANSELVAMRSELSQMRQILNVQMENVAWGNFSHRHPLEASIFKRLSRLGLSPALCRKLIRNLASDSDTKVAWKQVLAELSEDLPLLNEDMMAHEGIFAFVGPAGVGKTTTIAKIATRFVLEHGAENLALITTDSYRIAGHEQLNTLGRILKVPVRVVTEQQSLDHILRGLSRKRLILIDTAGLSHKDQVHTEQMQLLSELGANVQRWLVLSSTSQRRILDKAINEYKHLNLEGCILTKLDESASLGEALSVTIESQLPIAYITDGQNIPDDFEKPTASRLINHAIALARDYQMDDAVVADMYNDAIFNAEMALG